MLTKKQIKDLKNNNSEFGPAKDAIDRVIREVEEQRAIVFAALRCTGEDGHDGVTRLVVAAEEYLEKLQAGDVRWSDESISDNLEHLER